MEFPEQVRELSQEFQEQVARRLLEVVVEEAELLELLVENPGAMEELGLTHERVQELLLRGQEPGHGALGLEAAVDVAIKDSERSGVVAKLTRGLLSAESYWEQAVICCLTTFLHDESGLYKTLPQSSAALVRDRELRDGNEESRFNWSVLFIPFVACSSLTG